LLLCFLWSGIYLSRCMLFQSVFVLYERWCLWKILPSLSLSLMLIVLFIFRTFESVIYMPSICNKVKHLSCILKRVWWNIVSICSSVLNGLKDWLRWLLCQGISHCSVLSSTRNNESVLITFFSFTWKDYLVKLWTWEFLVNPNLSCPIS